VISCTSFRCRRAAGCWRAGLGHERLVGRRGVARSVGSLRSVAPPPARARLVALVSWLVWVGYPGGAREGLCLGGGREKGGGPGLRREPVSWSDPPATPQGTTSPTATRPRPGARDVAGSRPPTPRGTTGSQSQLARRVRVGDRPGACHVGGSTRREPWGRAGPGAAAPPPDGRRGEATRVAGAVRPSPAGSGSYSYRTAWRAAAALSADGDRLVGPDDRTLS
jgi:hypothetical protein